MTDMICLDEKYSTTRLLTKEKPEIISNPEDKFETVLFLPEGEERKGEGGLRTKGYFKKSFDDKPLISIITVVYNGEQFLEETIQSVINQTYDNVEYIIIDGGSTDRTLDIIKKYEDQIDYWVSEKDKGIYDAMNKGIDLASGEWINFMNAGDLFYDIHILSKIFKVNLKNKYFIYGNSVEFNKDLNQYYPKLSFSHNKIWYGMFAHHQSIFYNLNKIKDIGLNYNLQYKIAADYGFTYAFYNKIKGQDFYYINFPICIFELGGISDTKKELALKEANLIRKEIGKQSTINIFAINVLNSLKLILREQLPSVYNLLRYRKN